MYLCVEKKKSYCRPIYAEQCNWQHSCLNVLTCQSFRSSAGDICKAYALSILNPGKVANETATKAGEHVQCHRSVEEQQCFCAPLLFSVLTTSGAGIQQGLNPL